MSNWGFKMIINESDGTSTVVRLDVSDLVYQTAPCPDTGEESWSDAEILSLLDYAMPDFNVVAFELSDSAALRVTVAPMECSAFDMEGELELSIWTGSSSVTGLTKSQLGLYLETFKLLGDRGATEVARLLARQQN